MRSIAKFCVVQVIALFLVLSAHGEPISQLHPTAYVNDFAHVLAPNTVAQMESLCLQVDQKAHAQIAVVTIQSLDGADVESYAVDLYKRWGIGDKSSNRGVLILYVMRDHRSRIEVGYGLEPILPDGKVGSFQREAIPLMRSNDFNSALLLVTNRVSGVIAKDAGVTLENVPAETGRRQQQPEGLSLGGIIAILVIFAIILFTPLRGLLFWMLFSQGFGGGRGSSRGGWGGGGFGGGDGFGGGGGFGGFGGGSSGGGGASSSW